MPAEADQLFREHRELIESVVASVCHRNGLYGVDAEDFAQETHLKLIENDCARLRSFEERASFKTFVTVVVTNLCRDYKIKKWGKWRASAAALRLGPDAVQLERLIYRDDCTISAAIETLLARGQTQCSRRELEELAATLPRRLPRRFEGEIEDEDEVPDVHGSEDVVLDRERATVAERAAAALDAALRALPHECQLILYMKYNRGMTVTAIAAALGLDAKPLYRRIERSLARLRELMEAKGVDRDAIAIVWEWDGLELFVAFAQNGGIG